MKQKFGSEDLMRLRRAFRSTPYYSAIDEFGCFEGEDSVEERSCLLENGRRISLKISSTNRSMQTKRNLFEASLRFCSDTSDKLNLQISWSITNFEDALFNRKEISSRSFVPSGCISFDVESVGKAETILETFYSISKIGEFKKAVLDSHFPLTLSRKVGRSVTEIKENFLFSEPTISTVLAVLSIDGYSFRGKNLQVFLELSYSDNRNLSISYQEVEEMESGFKTFKKSECSRFLEISELKDFFNREYLKNILL